MAARLVSSSSRRSLDAGRSSPTVARQHCAIWCMAGQRRLVRRRLVALRGIFLDRPSAPETASKAHDSGYIEGPRADDESLRRARRIYFR